MSAAENDLGIRRTHLHLRELEAAAGEVSRVACMRTRQDLHACSTSSQEREPMYCIVCQVSSAL